jgi:parallel beta-helix repeat protein
VTVSGSGFAKGEQGSLAWDGDTAGMPAYKANGKGSFTVRFHVRTDAAAGAYVVSAISGSTDRANAHFIVTSVESPSPSPSATTSPTTSPTPTPTASPPATPTPSADPGLENDARFVSLAGSDTNAGTIDKPWRTLQHAARNASGAVYVRAGTYSGFTLERSGLRFRAYPGESVAVSGQIMVRGVTSAEISGFTIRDVMTAHKGGLEVEQSSGVLVKNNMLRDNSFGLKLKYATDTIVEDNDFTANASGIEVHYAGEGIVIRRNRIYENTRYLDTSRSATAINFYRTTGQTHFTDNLVWGNQMDDFSTGVGVEIYAASNIAITGNVFWDNGDLVETGTKNGVPCDNITFTRNVAFRTEGSEHKGLILRCASNSLIAHNTLVGLDKFAFGVSHRHGTYGDSVEGLRIVNNVVVDGRAYSIDNALPDSVIIDHNLAYTTSTSTAQYGRHLAYVFDRGNTKSLDTFRSWTGYEANGLSAEPLFQDAAARDYRLRAGSPAIDRGLILPDVEYTGLAPDLGRYETR